MRPPGSEAYKPGRTIAPSASSVQPHISPTFVGLLRCQQYFHRYDLSQCRIEGHTMTATNIVRWLRTGSVALVGVLAMTACSSDSSDELASAAVENYAALVHEAYQTTLESAEEMDAAIDTFVADPSEVTLATARERWLSARDDYGVTEAFRFYGGPIDARDNGVEGLVNAWPLDEAYIDYVEGVSDAGIVNDPDGYPTIDAAVITQLNEEGGETNISTGWHAIEFLLWGQDLSADGPGDRPFTDYTDAPNADRRATYLAVASDLLVDHLSGLVEAWAPDADNYRAEFLALETDEAVGMMITGMGELTVGELAGERMTVAYEERSQEDEHSCFSDNTTADYLANIAGIEAVATGSYGAVSGPGIIDLVASVDESAADAIRSTITSSADAAMAIPAPLDQWLIPGIPNSDPGRISILSTIEALEAQGVAIAEGAAALGVAAG